MDEKYERALTAVHYQVDYDPHAGTFSWCEPRPGGEPLSPRGRQLCTPGTQAGRFVDKHGGYYAITRHQRKVYGSHAAFVVLFGDDRPDIPEPQRGEWVYHLDGDRRNLRLENLVRVTDGAPWRVVWDEVFGEWAREPVAPDAVRDSKFRLV